MEHQRVSRATDVDSSKADLPLCCSHLSLVALLRPHTQDQHSAMIDYNVATFRQAVLAIFGVGVSAPIG